jgi:hypothetical protein
VRKADCKRLNDNAAVFEFTLHVQSSAGWWRDKEGRWQSMYGSGLTQPWRGQLDSWLGGPQLATHVWSCRTSNSGHARTFGTSKSMETDTRLAPPGTNNQGAMVLAAAHPCTSHPFRLPTNACSNLPGGHHDYPPFGRSSQELASKTLGGVLVSLLCLSRGARPDRKLPRTLFHSRGWLSP